MHKCKICGRDLIIVVNGITKQLACEFCDLNIITLDKCKICGTFYSIFLDKACNCRKIDLRG